MQGRQLLTQRNNHLTNAMTSLLQYGLVLKELLPGAWVLRARACTPAGCARQWFAAAEQTRHVLTEPHPHCHHQDSFFLPCLNHAHGLACILLRVALH